MLLLVLPLLFPEEEDKGLPLARSEEPLLGSAPTWGLTSCWFAKRDGEEGTGVLAVLGKHSGPVVLSTSD